MTDNPAHVDVREGAMNNQPAPPTNAERLKQRAQDASAALTDAANNPGQTAKDISDRVIREGLQAPQKAGAALLNFNREYGSTKEKTIVGTIAPTFNKGLAATRDRINGEGKDKRRSANIQPTFTSTKGVRPSAKIFKYSGQVSEHPHAHGSTPVNFGMGSHPVNFGAGSAIPHGASRGSAVPTTGSALNLGAMGTGSIGGSLFSGSLDFTKGMVTTPIKPTTKKKAKKK